MNSSLKAMRGTDTWLAVVQAYNLCNKRLSEQVAALGLTVAEHDVLMTLMHQPGINQQDVAKRCFVAKSGVSMLLAKFEKMGLIRREKDAEDSRIKQVYLSSKGQSLALKSFQIQEETVETMAAQLSNQDLLMIKEAMQRVSKALA